MARPLGSRLVVWGLRGALPILGVLAFVSAAHAAAATHWSGSGGLEPLVGYSSEVNRFTFTLNNSAQETLEVSLVNMVACWTGPSGAPIKPDDGANVTVAPSGFHAFTGDLSVPLVTPGLCHTAIVVKARTLSESSPGYGDYHFDVNYSAREPLQVSASADVSEGAPPLAVNLTAAVSGGSAPYTFAWDLGDGSNASGAMAAHAYANAGRYTATVTVTDAQGRRIGADTHVWVHSGLAVNGTASPTSGEVPLRVAFAALSVGGDGLVSFNWTFGDGSFAEGPKANHTFLQVGIFTVLLRAADAGGNSANSTLSVEVFPLLRAHIHLQPEGGAAPLAVRASAEVEGPGGPFVFHWVFSDGANAVGQYVSHTFTAPGNYAVYLHVTDSTSGRFFANQTNLTISAPRPEPTLEPPGILYAVLAAAVIALHERSRRSR